MSWPNQILLDELLPSLPVERVQQRSHMRLPFDLVVRIVAWIHVNFREGRFLAPDEQVAPVNLAIQSLNYLRR